VTWLFAYNYYCNFIYAQKCHEKSILRSFNVKKYVVICSCVPISGTITVEKNAASNTKGLPFALLHGIHADCLALVKFHNNFS